MDWADSVAFHAEHEATSICRTHWTVSAAKLRQGRQLHLQLPALIFANPMALNRRKRLPKRQFNIREKEREREVGGGGGPENIHKYTERISIAHEGTR